MTRRSTLLAALVALALPFMAASLGNAQFGGGRGVPPGLSRSVLVSGAGELSSETIAVVATALGRRLHRHEPEAKVSYIQLAATPNARVSDDMALYYLTVNRDQGAADLDEAQLDELWERVRRELERSLRIVQRTARAERQDWIGVRRRTLDQLSQRYHHELEEALAESERLGGEADGPLEEITAQLVDAVKRLRELQLERVSLDARREAIESRIDELRKQGEGAAESDPVLTELSRITEIRQQQLERTRAQHEQARVVTISEVQVAETALAEAKIDLLRAKRETSEQSSGPLLRGLNDELSKLFVQDAEVQARIKSLEELATKLREQTSVRTRLAINQVNDRIASLKARVEGVDEDIATLELRDAKDTVGEITIRSLDEALAPPAEAEESGGAP
jgi:chromosome segregation ATPase